MKNKVNLFVIGAQKCGTTSLIHLLKDLPEVATMPIKEGQFFTSWQDRFPDLTPEQFYGERFKSEANVMIDGSTTYSFYGQGEKAVKRILAYNPEAKFIYIVRNPIDRTISHYQHSLVRGAKLQPIDKAVLSGGFLDNSKYYSCILPFVEHVKPEHLLFLDLRELKALDAPMRKKLADFIGITIPEDIKFPVSNKSVGQETSTYNYRIWKKRVLKYLPDRVRIWVKYKFFSKKLEEKLTISPETNKRLQALLAEEMEAFYKLTGIDYRFA